LALDDPDLPVEASENAQIVERLVAGGPRLIAGAVDASSEPTGLMMNRVDAVWLPADLHDSSILRF
jgi:hypothetical protein